MLHFPYCTSRLLCFVNSIFLAVITESHKLLYLKTTIQIMEMNNPIAIFFCFCDYQPSFDVFRIISTAYL